MTPGRHDRPDDHACCPGCDVPDDDPAAITAFIAEQDAWLADTIRSYGWAVQSVLDDGPEHPPYAYTIGLHAFDHHPELLVSGLPGTSAARILNLLGERVRHHERLSAGQRLTLAPLLTIELRSITPLASDQLLLGANHLYRDPDGPAVPALQAIWADGRGRLPWEPTALHRGGQPLATAPPAEHSTAGDLVWHLPGRPGRAVRGPARPLRLPRPRRPPEIH